MNRFVGWGATVVLLTAGSIANGAIEFRDAQLPNRVVNASNPYNGTFDIVNPQQTPWTFQNLVPNLFDKGGYQPGEHVISAEITIGVVDDAVPLADAFGQAEYAKVVIDDFISDRFRASFTVFTATFGEISGTILGDIEDDGRLNYTVLADQGDFRLVAAGLCATVVPEPTSLLIWSLFGLAAAGCGVMRRRQISAGGKGRWTIGTRKAIMEVIEGKRHV